MHKQVYFVSVRAFFQFKPILDDNKHLKFYKFVSFNIKYIENINLS